MMQGHGVAMDPPVGYVLAFTGSIPPTTWLECDGSMFDVERYPELDVVLGAAYGERGRLPDGKLFDGSNITSGHGPELRHYGRWIIKAEKIANQAQEEE